MRIIFFATVFFTAIIGCRNNLVYEYDLDTDIPQAILDDLKVLELPEGFKIEIYAENIKNPRSIRYDLENDVLYVSTYLENKIYALKDTNKDFRADKLYIVAHEQNVEHRFKRYLPSGLAEKWFPGMLWPNGITLVDGDLYVAEPYNIKRINNVSQNLGKKPDIEIIFDKFPMRSYHSWKYMNLGPDKKLYMTNGSTCDACIEKDTTVAAICRMDLDGSNYEVYARGVRNSMGFTWHPVTKSLWFTDNGADHLGEESPPCELNEATRSGQHFGWPHIHGDDIEDVQMEEKIEVTTPRLNFEPHTAPLGIHFYTGDMFPSEYKNRLLVCEHGSKYKQLKSAYRVTMVDLDSEGNVISYKPFIEGWLKVDRRTFTDRPVDITELPDGSIVISSDYSDRIFRVSYDSTLIAQKN